jgi:GLPGLI family protein
MNQFLSFCICLLSLISSKDQTQVLQIKYDCNTNGVHEQIELTSNLTQSYSKTIKVLQDWGGFHDRLECSDVFKDYRSNTMYYEEWGGLFSVKEKISQFKWVITNERDSILNYSCTLASCHYRGREYKAWFTVEMPFKAAPWKFHGLPGVVLKVESTDNFFKAEAKYLSISSSTNIPDNKYINRKFISWKKFKKQYQNSITKQINTMKAYNAKTGRKNSGMSDYRTEVILEINQTQRKEEEVINSTNE